ncbi:MAG: glycosyltransferase family 2 protein [Nanoarchaeota archaeon]|nr:glycosyltransferase family 2 protein [Nanoarchaeota archaeon]
MNKSIKNKLKAPFFSIITPTLNSKKYLKECIKTIENQNFKDWEHIFIDSYSTDKTMNILKEYKKRNPSKVFIYQYPKAGISDAFNKGINHARGEYINFLGSDDLLERKSLSLVYNKLIERIYPWCYGDVKKIYTKGKVKVVRYKEFRYESLFYLFHICHQSVFMKKNIFERYGKYDTSLKYAMDHEYFLRIGKKEIPVKIDEILCSFRKGDNSTTSIFWASQLLEKRKINIKYGGIYRIIPIWFFFILTYSKKLILS